MPMTSYKTFNEKQKSSFSVTSHKQLDRALNSQLLSCIDINRETYSSKRDIIRQFKDEEICRYQSQLLKKYSANPSKYLRIEFDKLTATINCSATNIKRVLGKNGDNLTKIRSRKLASLAIISKVPVGKINKGHNTKTRPYYSMAFRVNWKGDKRKFFLIQISQESKKTDINALRIDFIPDRFSNEEIQLIMEHLASKLTKNIYFELIKNSKVTRLDQAVNLYGLFRPLIYISLPSNGVVEEIGNTANHTTYINDRRQSSHLIQYDKLLKEAKENPLLINNFDNLAVITRFEFRYFRHRDKNLKDNDIQINLDELGDIPIALYEIKIIDPLEFHKFSKKLVRRLLRKKNRGSYKNSLSEMKEFLNANGESLKTYSINEGWYCEQMQKQLDELSAAFRLEYDTENHDFDTITSSSEEAYDFSELIVPESEATRQQMKIIKSTHERIYVKAGPGSGKTHTLVERAKYLVKEGADPSSIQILTFTNEAVRTLRERLTSDKQQWSNINVATLSSFSLAVATNFSKRKPFIDKRRHLLLIKRASKELRRETPKKLTTEIVQNVVSYYRHSGNLIEAIELKAGLDADDFEDDFRKLIKKYEALKKEESRPKRLMDFEDLIRCATAASKQDKPVGYIDEIKYLLIDEVQDLSPLEWKLVIAIVKRQDCELMLVGDHAQSIFNFKGGITKANIFRKIINLKDLSISVNRRSSAPIVNLANAVLNQVKGSVQQQVPPSLADTALPEMIETNDFESAVDQICNEIRLHRKSKSVIQDIAIIVTTNKERKRICEILSKKQISYFSRDQEEGLTTAAVIKPTEKQVTVSTVHGVKGLEFKRVYFFDPRITNFKRADNKDTELALIYVAITRAIKHLTIVKSTSGKVFYSDAEKSDSYILDQLVELPMTYRFI